MEKHSEYQNRKCSELTDKQLIIGFIKAYQYDKCNADHTAYFETHLATDECRYFTYPNGWSDHFNMRWFNDWIKNNRPHLLEKLTALKVFW